MKRRRSTKTSRNASLKAWRTRRKMRERRIADIGLQRYREEIARDPVNDPGYLERYQAALRRSLHQTTGQSIDLLPKVEWEK